MAQSNTSFPQGSEISFEFQRGVMAVEVLQNEEISVRGKNGWRKGVGSAICWRRANRGSINIKK